MTDDASVDERICQERDRIARDLHDGVIQAIFAVGLNLDYCRLVLRESPDEVEARLGEAIECLNEAIFDIRAYVLDLTDRVGDQADLRRAAESVPDSTVAQR